MALRSTGLGGKVDGNQEVSYLSLDVFRQAASQPPSERSQRELLSDDLCCECSDVYAFELSIHLSSAAFPSWPSYRVEGHTGLGKGRPRLKHIV